MKMQSIKLLIFGQLEHKIVTFHTFIHNHSLQLEASIFMIVLLVFLASNIFAQ